MKPHIFLKYLQNLEAKRNSQEGLTLIELLIVIMIMALLAAIAIPNLISQVGKARETELKTLVGSVNRAQVAYHYERQTFADSLSDLGIKINSDYISNADEMIKVGHGNHDFDGTGTIAAPINYTTPLLGINGGSTINPATPRDIALIAPINSNAIKDGTRGYSGAVKYQNGLYEQVMCVSDNVRSFLTAPGDTFQAPSDVCKGIFNAIDSANAIR